ncbi:MAG TPA: hypothetical protein VK464_12655, partial [Symbiobacteriaceae bacterium]|nr:hypothetical protein [Symbiobacteriaceae bacterium]
GALEFNENLAALTIAPGALAFSGVTALAWALFSQLALAVPLFAQKVLGLEASIGLLWTTSSLAVIAFQVPVTRYVTARMAPATAMAAGVAILGAGLGLVGLARSFTGLLLAVLVFVAGEMLLMPTVDSTVSTMAREGAVGSYFGVASFAWGLGEGLGNLTGGALMQYALGAGRPRLPWPIYTGVGVGLAVLYKLVVGRRATTAPPGTGGVVQVYRPGQPAPDQAGSVLGPPREPD